MIEQPAKLRTWVLPEVPVVRGPMRCEALQDHRKVYLDYEGPLSLNRGRVTRWDHGIYTVASEREDVVALCVRGVRLAGTITLLKLDAEGMCWTYTFHGFAGCGPARRETRPGRG